MIRGLSPISTAILVCVSSGINLSRSLAKTRLTNFEDVDSYVSTNTKELGIPGAALVIVQGDQIAHLKALGVADGTGRHAINRQQFNIEK